MLAIDSGALGTPGTRPAQPRLLLAAADRVLLEAMTRVLTWMRGRRWVLEIAADTAAVKLALGVRSFDLVVVCLEPGNDRGNAMLRTARLHAPHVRRIAYRTCAGCDAAELRQVDAVVPWPADVAALTATLDRELEQLAAGNDAQLDRFLAG